MSNDTARKRTVVFECADCGRQVERLNVGAGLCKPCSSRRNSRIAHEVLLQMPRKGEDVPCVVCGTMVYQQPGRSRRFCSQRCMGIAFRKPKACAVCGTEFWFSKSPLRSTCSPACTNKLKSIRQKGKKPSPEAIARARVTSATRRAEREGGLLPPAPKKCARPGCQNPLTGQAHIYCSPRCHYDDRARAGRRSQAYHRCYECDTVFPWNGRGRGIFCSRECKNRAGLSPARDPIIVEIVQIRGHRRADFRDESEVCRSCGAPAAHNHHAVYKQHIERVKGDRWHPDAAIALCVKCHGLAHAHTLPVSVLRPENLAFAVDLFGVYAVDYLRRYYHDDGDPRLEAMTLREAA